MSSDHANCGFLPPSTADITDDIHRQPPPSSATFENLHRFTALPLPQTSPRTPTITTSNPNNNTAVENTTTPESQLAAVLGRAINAIPPTSFRHPTVNTQNPLRRTVSDASSSDYSQPSTITTTPPKAPDPARRTPLRRTVSAPISIHHQEPNKTMTPPPQVPVARPIFPSTNPRTTAPQSSNRKESPGFKRLRKIEETVRDIEQRCWDVMQECESGVAEEHIEEDNSYQAMVEEQVKEECVAFETLSDGGLRFRLSCSCGKGFEILLKDNGRFYKLT
ncbi:hypothetical protein L6452_22515 [Arctium lappa]|uniref:Uncharacterized protein n=1 Tax=Arctium lappa TaxID=4217 RepID=A0ACB9AZ57_ARCLA|nr:hypothetical protein L6452_22515 [Arctium lappa]